jgi:hypothetical protein
MRKKGKELRTLKSQGRANRKKRVDLAAYRARRGFSSIRGAAKQRGVSYATMRRHVKNPTTKIKVGTSNTVPEGVKN